MEEQEGILAKVQKLLDKAWSTTFEPEKEALLAKADALMTKYSIDQFMLLDPSRPNTAAAVKAATPEVRTIVYFQEGSLDLGLETLDLMSQLFWHLAMHNHVRIGSCGYKESKVVGYNADLDFLEMMFLGLKLHVISTVSPRCDPAKTWGENVALMKGAGYKWEQIHEKLTGHPGYPKRDAPWSKSVGLRMYDEYKKWCEANLTEEEDRVKANPKQWREGFLYGYVAEVRERLARMRQESLKSNPNLPDVLASKKNPLDEMLREHFPSLRPPTEEERAAAEAARLEQEKANKRKPVRYREPKPRYVSTAAANAGRRSARTADLSGTNGRMGAAKAGELGG